MASDVSSGNLEVNTVVESEKEDGELSLEDVSSSEEAQVHRYLPRMHGQCRYCLSKTHCATWCASLPANQNKQDILPYCENRKAFNQTAERHIVYEDAGKENRRKYHRHRPHRHHRHHQSPSTTNDSNSADAAGLLQEKNKPTALFGADNLELISSDTDVDTDTILVGFDKKTSKLYKYHKKKHRIASTKSPVEFSDIELSDIEALPQLLKPIKKHLENRRKKLSSSSIKQKQSTVKRLKKNKKIQPSTKLPECSVDGLETPLPLKAPDVKVTKLLKKVRQLDSVNHCNKESGSSLMYKLSNMMKPKQADIVSIENNSKLIVNDKKNLSKLETCTKDEAVEKKIRVCKPLRNNEIISVDKKDCSKREKKIESEKSERKSNGSSLKCNDKHSTKKDTAKSFMQTDKNNTIGALIMKSNQKSEVHKNTNEVFIADEKEDDDDVVLLQQQNAPLKKIDSSKDSLNNLDASDEPLSPVPPPENQKLPNFCIDDNDEDLKLRMEALRSAVIKKHRTRILCGKTKAKEQKNLPLLEPPFSSNLKDDFPELAKICDPLSPSLQDIYCSEDMELDSDMELELNSPYSPSDDVMDVEISVLQSSLYSPSCPTETPKIQRNVQSGTINRNIYECSAYSPSDNITFEPELHSVHNLSPLQPPPMPPMDLIDPQPMLFGCQLLNHFMEPIHMLPAAAGNLPTMRQAINPMLLPSTRGAGLFPYNSLVSNSGMSPTLAAKHSVNNEASIVQGNKIKPVTNIPDLIETDLDGSPLVPIDCGINSPNMWPLVENPLYGSELLPAIKNHAHLNYGRLVPAPVLKVNKHLQKEPCPRKNLSSLLGKGTFKSAEMHVISQEPAEHKLLFQPMRLNAQVKQVISHPDSAFNEAGSISSNKSNSHIKTTSKLEEKLTQEVNCIEDSIQKKAPNQKRRGSADEDLETLRQNILESMAKKKKISTENAPTDNKNEVNKKSTTFSQLVESRRKRVVNNAKRFQNNINQQRKQRTALLAASKNRIKIKIESEDETLLKNNNQFLIDLGDDSDSEAENDKMNKSFESRPELNIPTSDFEKNLEQFLKQVRQQQEANSGINISNTNSDKQCEKSPEISEQDSSQLSHESIKPEKNSIIDENLIDTASATSPSTEKDEIGNIPNLAQTSSNKRRKRKRRNNLVTRVLSGIPKTNTPVEKDANSSEKSSNNLAPQVLSVFPKTNIPIEEVSKLVEKSSDNLIPQVLSTIPKTNTLIEKVVDNSTPVDSSYALDTTNTEIDTTFETNCNNSDCIPTNKVDALRDKPDNENSSSSNALETTIISTLNITPVSNSTINSKTLENAAKTVIATINKPIITKDITTIITPTSKSTLKTSDFPALANTKSGFAAMKVSGTANTSAIVSGSANKPSNSLKTMLACTTEINKEKTKNIISLKQVKRDLVAQDLDRTPQAVRHLPADKQNEYRRLKQQLYELECRQKQMKSSTALTDKPTVSSTSSLPTENSLLMSSPSISKTTVDNSSRLRRPIITAISKPQSSNIMTSTQRKQTDIVSPTKIVHTVTQATRVTSDKKQELLLNKMNKFLNNQNSKMNAAAQKASVLRILTKEQINNKSVESNQHYKSIVTDKSASNSATNSNMNKDTRIKTFENLQQIIGNETQERSSLDTKRQKKLLSETEEKLIAKRHSVLDDITEMSGYLREWEFEREVQNTRLLEIKKLQEQLKQAQERLKLQREKLNNIQPKVTFYHEKINEGRKECFNLSKICNSLGQKVIGSNYKAPTAGGELLKNRLIEVNKHTRKLRGQPKSSNQRENIKTETPSTSSHKVNNNDSRLLNINQNASHFETATNPSNTANVVTAVNAGTIVSANSSRTNAQPSINNLPNICIKQEVDEMDDNKNALNLTSIRIKTENMVTSNENEEATLVSATINNNLVDNGSIENSTIKDDHNEPIPIIIKNIKTEPVEESSDESSTISDHTEQIPISVKIEPESSDDSSDDLSSSCDSSDDSVNNDNQLQSDEDDEIIDVEKVEKADNIISKNTELTEVKRIGQENAVGEANQQEILNVEDITDQTKLDFISISGYKESSKSCAETVKSELHSQPKEAGTSPESFKNIRMDTRKKGELSSQLQFKRKFVSKKKEQTEENRDKSQPQELVTKESLLQPYESVLGNLNPTRVDKSDSIVCLNHLMGICSNSNCPELHFPL